MNIYESRDIKIWTNILMIWNYFNPVWIGSGWTIMRVKFELSKCIYMYEILEVVSCAIILCVPKFLIYSEALAKLAQERLVCAPLGRHFEPINKQLLVIINCTIWPKERTVLCQIGSSLGMWCAIWAYQKLHNSLNL